MEYGVSKNFSTKYLHKLQRITSQWSLTEPPELGDPWGHHQQKGGLRRTNQQDTVGKFKNHFRDIPTKNAKPESNGETADNVNWGPSYRIAGL